MYTACYDYLFKTISLTVRPKKSFLEKLLTFSKLYKLRFVEIISISFSHTRSWTLLSNTLPAVKILCDLIMTRRHLQSIWHWIKGASTMRFVVALIVLLKLSVSSRGLLGFLASILKEICMNDNERNARNVINCVHKSYFVLSNEKWLESTLFFSMFPFYASWKHQKPKVFCCFQGA